MAPMRFLILGGRLLTAVRLAYQVSYRSSLSAERVAELRRWHERAYENSPLLASGG
jgi:hypothetical protein